MFWKKLANKVGVFALRNTYKCLKTTDLDKRLKNIKHRIHPLIRYFLRERFQSLRGWVRALWRLTSASSSKLVLISHQNISFWTNISQPQSVSGPITDTQRFLILFDRNAISITQNKQHISAPNIVSCRSNVGLSRGFSRFPSYTVFSVIRLFICFTNQLQTANNSKWEWKVHLTPQVFMQWHIALFITDITYIPK